MCKVHEPMILRALTVSLVAASLSGCALFGFEGSPEGAIDSTVTGTDQAVEQFLTGRQLDAVEGAWEHDESAFEVVISRNQFDIADGYDYVGIITRSDQPMWHNGEVKILLRNTNDEGVFEGVWMTRNKSRRQMTFVVEHDNLIQASFVSADGNTYFARIRRIQPRFASAH